MKKVIEINGKEIEVNLLEKSSTHLSFEYLGEKFVYHILGREKDRIILQNDGAVLRGHTYLYDKDGAKQVFLNNLEAVTKVVPKAKKSFNKNSFSEGSLQSPMPGKIFKLLKSVGDSVEAGEPVLILEAMKMEHTIKATTSGTVKELFFEEGAQVTDGVLLCEIESEKEL